MCSSDLFPSHDRQEDILNEILDNYKAIEKHQERINALVLINREAVKRDPNYEDDYTEWIERYYTNV